MVLLDWISTWLPGYNQGQDWVSGVTSAHSHLADLGAVGAHFGEGLARLDLDVITGAPDAQGVAQVLAIVIQDGVEAVALLEGRVLCTQGARSVLVWNMRFTIKEWNCGQKACQQPPTECVRRPHPCSGRPHTAHPHCRSGHFAPITSSLKHVTF